MMDRVRTVSRRLNEKREISIFFEFGLGRGIDAESSLVSMGVVKASN